MIDAFLVLLIVAVLVLLFAWSNERARRMEAEWDLRITSEAWASRERARIGRRDRVCEAQ